MNGLNSKSIQFSSYIVCVCVYYIRRERESAPKKKFVSQILIAHEYRAEELKLHKPESSSALTLGMIF
jgi:hypothetical protein